MNPIQHLTSLKNLLLIEYEEEKNLFKLATERKGLTRLENSGNAWLRIKLGNSFYNSLNQRIIEIYNLADDDNDDHNFEFGKPVVLFSWNEYNADKPKFHFNGTVSFVDGKRMLMVIPDDTVLPMPQDSNEFGVMLSFDETTYRVMFDALDYMMRAKGRAGELRDLVYSKRKAGELTLSPMRFPYLNSSQEEGVNKILKAKDIAILHGPPGTGKTTTLVEAINETLHRETQVLVCAQSNMAVDWISEKLTDRGINVLRIGNPSRVNDKMLSFTYERRFEDHPDYPTLWSIRKSIRELRGAQRHSTEQWHQKMDRLKSRATELEIRINNDIFSSAHVIASTLTGSAARVLDGMKFSTVFIDEAAQALEAASWIPVRKAGRIILAGDHCQLPPTVKSYTAMKQGLGKSLMETIVENHPETVKLLSVQYRMNDEIMEFSNQWFYSGEMTSAPEVKYRNILDFDTPIEWVDTSERNIDSDEGEIDSENSYSEIQVRDNMGKVNPDEAKLTLQVLQDYIERIGTQRFLEENIDVGLISPYRAQVHYLRKLLKSISFFKPFRKSISINTVDGFQGQERDVVVISMVRSNEEGNIGFLRDLRRMNVAITRARMKLLIIGNAKTLSSKLFYSKFIEYIRGL